MASDLRTRIEEDHLTCQICFLSFTKPKALPCLHTFCEQCLREFIVSRNFETQGYFQCPMCRQDIQIPPTGVSGFQDNHLVQSLSHTLTGPEIPTNRVNVVESNTEETNFRPTPAPRKSKMKVDTNDTECENKPPAPSSVSLPPSLDRPAAPPRPPLPNPLPTTGIYPDLPPPYPEAPDPPQSRPRSTSIIPCSNGLVQQIGHYGTSITDFLKPKGLTVGLNNEIIVSDLGGNRIFIYNAQGQLQSSFICDCIIHDLTITPKGTILVAVNKCKSAIMREYSMTGRLMANHGNHYLYENPSGIALNSDGFSIVTCLDSCVMYILTDQKKLSQKVGRKGKGNDHFMSPYHVAVNNKDQIFVSDCGNNCIKVFSKAGKFKMNIGHEGSGTGELRAPLGVCTNADGYVIVADSGNFRVQVFNPKGQHYCIPLQHTQRIGPDVKPKNVAVTTHDNLVVLLSGANFAEVRVYAFKSENGIYCSTCYTQ